MICQRDNKQLYKDIWLKIVCQKVNNRICKDNSLKKDGKMVSRISVNKKRVKNENKNDFVNRI